MLTKFDEGRYEGNIETLGSNKVCTSVKGWFNSEDENDVDSTELEPAEHKRNGCDKRRDRVCWTVPEMKTQESQLEGVSDGQGFATTCRERSRRDQARIPEKQKWVRFGERAKLMHIRRGSGGTCEEAPNDMWAIHCFVSLRTFFPTWFFPPFFFIHFCFPYTSFFFLHFFCPPPFYGLHLFFPRCRSWKGAVILLRNLHCPCRAKSLSLFLSRAGWNQYAPFLVRSTSEHCRHVCQ